MTVFTISIVKCIRCGGKFESASGMEHGAIIGKGGIIWPLCKKCGKAVEKFIKTPPPVRKDIDLYE